MKNNGFLEILEGKLMLFLVMWGMAGDFDKVFWCVYLFCQFVLCGGKRF